MIYYVLPILSIILLFTFIYFIGGFLLFKNVLIRKNKRNYPLLPYEQDTSFFDDEIVKSIYTGSAEKGTLHAYLKQNNTNKWVILCHGYAADARTMSIFAKQYYEKGYNVLSIDARAHGDSGGKIIGMGWLEKHDIISWCNYLIKNYGNDVTITLFGISMGAATLMMICGEDDLPTNVTSIIEDSGYDNIYEVFKHSLFKKYYILSFIPLSALRFFTNNIAYYDLKEEASAIESLNKCKVPMLFIRGSKDTSVPVSSFNRMYEACNAPKQQLIIENAKHSEGCTTDANMYWSNIFEFLNKYDKEECK
ncbi:MAG: alpha/beta hydrolase [Erysipelotrichales bacterium]|nr:alpha/beta hydrolase [Erysipelotrichales bacterium]